MSSERGKKHTQSKLYSYPKEHNSIDVSSVLIKFKIDYKNKKTLVQIQPITDINEIKKRDPQKSTMQKFQGTFIYNFPLAYTQENNRSSNFKKFRIIGKNK